jgi:hypothetical protein
VLKEAGFIEKKLPIKTLSKQKNQLSLGTFFNIHTQGFNGFELSFVSKALLGAGHIHTGLMAWRRMMR